MRLVHGWLTATAGLLLFVGVLVPPAASAATDVSAGIIVTRYGGADRYSTSLLAAEAIARGANGELDWAVIVSGRSWPDAVVAASVAGVLDAPVLMSPPDRLRGDAAEFLSRTGVKNALVIDTLGPGSDPGARISDDVTDALAVLGISAERVSGTDRYETAAAAARKLGRLLSTTRNDQGDVGVMAGLGRTAFVASGEVFADALVAGPIAARGGHPVLLTPRDRLHRQAASFLSAASVDHVVLMGGTAALSPVVENSLDELGVSVTRLAGTTRYDTAVKLAELSQSRYGDSSSGRCFGQQHIGLARADVPFDSFSAAPLLARACAPLVLAVPRAVPTETAEFLDSARSTAGRDSIELAVFGGDAAVSDAALSAYAGSPIITGASSEGDSSGLGDTSQQTLLPAGSCGGKATDSPVEFLGDIRASELAWSPDCRHVAYVHDLSIWIADIDGSQRRRLVSEPNTSLQHPAWSPDGQQIAFSSRPLHGTAPRSTIGVVNLDGTRKRQLTDATHSDDSPEWSPDGSRIAFVRRFSTNAPGDGLTPGQSIMSMDPDGRGQTQITEPGSWTRSPKWSPDGSRIAYVGPGSTFVADPDGRNEIRIAAASRRDIAWSPSGDRIALVDTVDGMSRIKTVDTQGLGGAQFVRSAGRPDFLQRSDGSWHLAEHPIALVPGRVHSLSWSPDGELITASAWSDEQARTRVWIAGSAGTMPTLEPSCMPIGVGEASEHIRWSADASSSSIVNYVNDYPTTAGFPLAAWTLPATGATRVAVLFVDFPDARADYSTRDLLGESLARATRILEASSGGKLDVSFSVLHEWLRAEDSFETYLEGGWLGTKASQHSVELADGKLDFSDIDAVLTIFPSDHFAIADATGNIDVGIAGGSGLPTIRLNVQRHRSSGPTAASGSTIVHEMLHLFGLADLYLVYGDTQPTRRNGSVLIRTEFGQMGLTAYSHIDEADPSVGELHLSSGSRSSVDSRLWLNDMLGWSRWQLGWLAPTQVRCVEEPDAFVAIDPVIDRSGGTRLAVVPIDIRRVLVAEVRHLRRDDVSAPSFTQGVLVYTVDAGRRSLPIKIRGEEDRVIEGRPLLQAGESVTVLGHRIAVLAERDGRYAVRIRRES